MTIPIESFLPGLIKAAGQVGSYFIQRGDIARQNRYNSPAQQVKRLREAGLPYAAAGDFKNEQTNVPDVSGIAGAGESIGGYIQTEIDRKKLGILGEEIKQMRSLTRIKGNEANFSDAEAQYLLNEGYIRDGDAINWFKHRKEIETNMMEIQRALTQDAAGIKKVERNVAEATSATQIETVKQQLQSIISSINLKTQAFGNIEAEKASANALYDMMKEGGLSMWEALGLQVLQGFTGKVGSGGFQIGN